MTPTKATHQGPRAGDDRVRRLHSPVLSTYGGDDVYLSICIAIASFLWCHGLDIECPAKAHMLKARSPSQQGSEVGHLGMIRDLMSSLD